MWAQKGAGQQTSGQYSWHDVRGYYHQALVSTDPGSRNMHFWQTFEGLGRLMHLVQDSSVPEHVRSDSHVNPMAHNYEKMTRKLVDTDEFRTWLSNTSRYTYDDSLSQFPPGVSGLAPIPIARMVDTDRYSGANPEETVNQPIGIAEYTNANFFSKDTIFKGFEHPARSSFSLPEYLDRPIRGIRPGGEEGISEENGRGATRLPALRLPGRRRSSACGPGLFAGRRSLPGLCRQAHPAGASYSAGLL